MMDQATLLNTIAYWRNEYRDALVAEEQAHTRATLAHNRLMDVLVQLPEPVEPEQMEGMK